MRNGHFRQGEPPEKRCCNQHASQLYLLATPKTLVCTIHLSNNNVSSHDTSSIIAMNYLSPMLPNFSCLVTILEFKFEGITSSLIDHHISHSALHRFLSVYLLNICWLEDVKGPELNIVKHVLSSPLHSTPESPMKYCLFTTPEYSHDGHQNESCGSVCLSTSTKNTVAFQVHQMFHMLTSFYIFPTLYSIFTDQINMELRVTSR